MNPMLVDNNSQKRRNVIIAIIVVIIFVIFFPRIMFVISLFSGRYHPNLPDKQINNVLPITPAETS